MELKLNELGDELMQRQPDPKITSQEAEVIVQDALTVPVNINQYNALVSFCVSLGEANFLRSILLKTLNDGDFESAREMFIEYTNGGDKELIRLRKAEKRVFIQRPKPALKCVVNRGRNDNVAKYTH